MGACLSCLGLGNRDREEAERSRLLYDDYPANHGYGTWGASTVPPQNLMSPEEVQREQEALDHITRWASDQIVEIFPHQYRNLGLPSSQILGNGNGNSNGNGNGTGNGNGDTPAPLASHQDILLALIPGDKSKRSIRIYPASRPSSKDAQSLRSKSSFAKMNGTGKKKDTPVLVTLDVNLP